MPNYYVILRGNALNIRYQVGKKKQPIPLKISIEPKYFYSTGLTKEELEQYNPDGKWISKKHKDHIALNLQITNWLAQLRTHVINFHTEHRNYPEPKSLAGFFKNKPASAAPQTFKEIWADFLKAKTAEQLSAKRLQHYQGTLNKILEYRPAITLAEVNTETFYFAFKGWLAEEHENGGNTIGSRIRMLKCFLNWAVLQGRIVMPPEVKSKMIGRNEKRDPISLNLSERQALSNYNLQYDPHMERVRDGFILLCETGLRRGDGDSKTWNNDGCFIRVWPKKTRNETPVIATIPITTELRRLLDKYGDDLPFMSEREMNINIKTIAAAAGLNRPVQLIWGRKGHAAGKVVPLWKLVSCHAARSTFITECGNSGEFTTAQIAAMAGITEKQVATYLDIKSGPLESSMKRMEEKQLRVTHKAAQEVA